MTIGKPFRLENGGYGSDTARAHPAAGATPADIIVGVAGSARLVSPEDSDAVEIYRLADANLSSSMVVLVKTAGPAEAALNNVTSLAKATDPTLFPDVQLMKRAFRDKVQIASYSTLSVTLLAALALLLACTVFAATVTLAALLPARRALRIDPLRALRHE